MTVRISDKLTAQVVESIGMIYRRKLEDHDKLKPQVGDRLFELIYGPHRDTMELLPECFFRRFDSITVERFDDLKWTTTFKLSTIMRGAYSHPDSSDIASAGFGGDRVYVKRTPQTEDIIDSVLAWRGQMLAIGEVRENSQKAVRDILKRHASLPPAIKTFPPLVDLLPPEVRRKIEVPQHKLTSAEMELNPHLKQLATDIVLHKILNR